MGKLCDKFLDWPIHICEKLKKLSVNFICVSLISVEKSNFDFFPSYLISLTTNSVFAVEDGN